MNNNVMFFNVTFNGCSYNGSARYKKQLFYFNISKDEKRLKSSGNNLNLVAFNTVYNKMDEVYSPLLCNC